MNATHPHPRAPVARRRLAAALALAAAALAACSDAPSGTTPPRLDYNNSTTCNGLAPTIYRGMPNEAQHYAQLADGRWRIFGTAGNDVILGTPTGDDLFGGDGDDVMCGEGGDDLMHGGPGDDWMHGGLGNDLLAGAEGADVVQGSAGDDHLEGNDGDDTVVGGTENDYVNGGPGADQVGGGQGTDACVDAESTGFANCESFPGGAGVPFKLGYSWLRYEPYPAEEEDLVAIVQDAAGNPTTSPITNVVKLSLANGPGGCLRAYGIGGCWGAPFEATHTAGNPPGTIYMPTFLLDKAGAHTLWLTSPGLESVSIPVIFDISRLGLQYAFRPVTQRVIAGRPVTIEVEMEDPWGNLVDDAGGTTRIAAIGPGVMTGPRVLPVVNGVSTFTMTFGAPGKYTLQACVDWGVDACADQWDRRLGTTTIYVYPTPLDG